MSKVLKNGKYYLDECYNCGQLKDEIDHHRKIKDPRYCVTVTSNESGTEVDGEWDRHRFVISKRAWDADLLLERQWIDDMKASIYG